MKEKINKIITTLQEIQNDIDNLQVETKEDKTNYVCLSPTMFSKIVNLIANVENQGIVEKGFLNEVLKEVQYPIEENEEEKIKEAVEEEKLNNNSSEYSNKAKSSEKKKVNKEEEFQQAINKLTEEELEHLAYALFVDPLLHYRIPKVFNVG